MARVAKVVKKTLGSRAKELADGVVEKTKEYASKGKAKGEEYLGKAKKTLDDNITVSEKLKDNAKTAGKFGAAGAGGAIANEVLDDDIDIEELLNSDPEDLSPTEQKLLRLLKETGRV